MRLWPFISAYIFYLVWGIVSIQAQMIEISPENPTPDDTIIITFFADKGNRALMDYEGEVYLHTGVITGSVEARSSWRYVQGDWGKDDPKVKMTRVAKNIYQKRLHIRSFYQLGISEPFLQLVLVCRNRDGSLVATPEGKNEIYYPSLKALQQLDLEEANADHARYLGNYEQHAQNGNHLLLQTEGLALGIWFYRENTARTILFAGSKRDIPTSEWVIDKALTPQVPEIMESDSLLSCTWGDDSRLEIEKFPLQLRWYHKGKQVLADHGGYFIDADDKTLGFRMHLQEGEKIYGTGSRAIPLNRRSHRLYLYNAAKDGYEEGEERLNISVPYVSSSKGYGLLIDEAHRAYIDIGHHHTAILEYGARKVETLSYYLSLSDSPAYLLKQLGKLTGTYKLPPIWALGYLQSRHAYQNQAEVEEIVRRTLASGIPIDGVVLDEYWYGDKNEMGNFDWDRGRFPRPSKMLADFREKGIYTILGQSPYVLTESQNFGLLANKQMFAQSNSRSPYIISDFEEGPSALLDIFQAKTQDWLWKQYKRQQQQGVAAWMLRKGEPESHPYNLKHGTATAEMVHNLYALEWAKMLDEKFKEHFPAKRLFHLSRSGTIGMQRYSTFPWSGAVASSWSGLKTQVGMMLSMGMSGIGYMHSALGGFVGDDQNDELYIRWMQLGTFSPIMWAHGAGIPSEPFFYQAQTAQLAKDAIDLRYQLLPYNYSLAWQNSLDGTPLARPLSFHYPEDSSVWEIETQYLWGEQFLVAPVLQAGQEEKQVYFPKGRWIDFWKGEIYESGWHAIPVEKQHIPLFVKGGAMFPLSLPMKNTSDYQLDSLLFHYYPDLSQPVSSFDLYMDDGQDAQAVKEKRYRLIKLKAEASAKKIVFDWNIAGNGYGGEAPTINFFWDIHGIKEAPKKIKWLGSKLRKAESLREFNSTSSSYYWEIASTRLYLHLNWPKVPTDLIIYAKGWAE